MFFETLICVRVEWDNIFASCGRDAGRGVFVLHWSGRSEDWDVFKALICVCVEWDNIFASYGRGAGRGVFLLRWGGRSEDWDVFKALICVRNRVALTF